MKKPILITLSTFSESGPEPLAELEASGHPFILNTLGRRMTKEEVIQAAENCAAVVAGVEPYDEELFGALPGLVCVSRCGVGVDAVDLEAAREHGVTVRNTPDVVIRPVAEMALGMTLDLLKRLTAHTALMRAGRWERLTGGMLDGARVGVVGLGRIGRGVAELFAACGARVSGFDPHPDLEWASRNGVEIVSFEELLATSQVVTVHVSLPPDTPQLVFGAEQFSAMQQGALFVNTSRGRYVDEDALVAALESGHLGGAGLDVYSEEPYSGPLLGFDNVVLTPHVATLTAESRTEMELQAVKNAIETLAEEGL